MPDKKRNPKDMYTSVSAITDADDCLRRWWLNKRCKIPQDQRKATIFGDVHHAVCARFLEADDRGLDLTTGKPVVLYPEGWRVMADRFDKSGTLYKVSDSEAALIKILIQKAITEGVLLREPQREVEREFETVIFSKGYLKVFLRGFVDLTTPRSIEDHKTTKNKKYLLSKAKLKKSIQMMGYAYERYLQKHQGNIWLCHNGFVKDFDMPYIKKTEVEVTQIEVMDFFNDKILPIIKRMLKYYTEYPPTRISDWRNVPPADNSNQSCNHHYGAPCPYVMICSGLITLDNYLRKYGMTVTDITGKTENIEKGKPMSNSLMSKIKQEQAAQAGTTATPVKPVASLAEVAAATEVKEQPVQQISVGGLAGMLAKVQAGAKAVAGVVKTAVATAESVEQVAGAVQETLSDKQTAPWYTFPEGEAGCPACKDNDTLGFNTKMEPCMICVSRARAQGKLCPEDFEVDVLEDGKLQFKPRQGGEATTTQVSQEPTVKTVVQPVIEKPTSTLADTVKHAAANQTAASPITDALAIAAASKETRPSLNTSQFDIFLGCAFVKKSADECVEMYADVLVKEMLDDISAIAAKPWATLDHFALMQAIDAYAESLLPRLSGHVIISTIPSKGGAHARLIDGLRLHAASVITPLAG